MEYNFKLFEKTFLRLYGKDTIVLEKQFARYENLVIKFSERFETEGVHFFSTPGRTEIGGNHTDHNNGRVLAASINLDSIAVASKCKEQKVVLFSEGYEEPFKVDLNRLDPVEAEKGTTTALMRGIASRFKQLGYCLGGFNAFMASDVLPGSGLSSSASVEVLIGTIFNHLYNEGQVPAEVIAQIGQYAENVYFDKPCGLMDQMTCSVGGIICIDFVNPQKPQTEKISFDFDGQGYNLLIVNTGGNHADLTEDYAAIPAEMKAVAAKFDKKLLRDVSEKELMENLAELRISMGDRAILRALHYFEENKRVLKQVEALKAADFQQFLELVQLSGNSSFKWLQNIYTVKNIREQGVSLALALSEKYISESGAGSCRVHGGGFAGTVQVFLPKGHVDAYVDKMEKIFGEDSVNVLNIRPVGAIYLNGLE